MEYIFRSLEYGIVPTLIVLTYLLVTRYFDNKKELKKLEKEQEEAKRTVKINAEILDAFNELNTYLKHITKDIVKIESDKCVAAIKSSFRSMNFGLTRFATFTIINNKYEVYMDLKYKRVIIKISGEALAGDKGMGFDQKVVDRVVNQIKAVHDMGVQIGIVVGGGNFWRGRQGTEMDRTTADHMGMLATVINALALQDAIERKGVQTRVQTALTITRVAEPYILRKALSHLEKGRIVIFACGTGNPFFSTDTAVALRAAEMNAEVILLAKNVDGIYDSDPKTNPNAKKYKEIKYIDFISQGLKAMDTAAVAICMENKTPILAFGLNEENSIARVVKGEDLGTWIR